MINDISITFTFNSENDELTIQASNSGVTEHQLRFYLHTLIDKILNDKFIEDSDGSSYYIEKTYKLELE